MEKQNHFPTAMNDIGHPAEMSPASDLSSTETKTPILEVNRPTRSEDPLEIRNSLS